MPIHPHRAWEEMPDELFCERPYPTTERQAWQWLYRAYKHVEHAQRQDIGEDLNWRALSILLDARTQCNF